jgi:hypothetical protein
MPIEERCPKCEQKHLPGKPCPGSEGRTSRPRRPEWLTCVASEVAEGHELHGKTWCGLKPTGFTFTSIDHAALNGRAKGRLVVCPECATQIKKALDNGTESRT